MISPCTQPVSSVFHGCVLLCFGVNILSSVSYRYGVEIFSVSNRLCVDKLPLSKQLSVFILSVSNWFGVDILSI